MRRLISVVIVTLIIFNGLFAATLKPDESLGGSAQTFLNIGFPYNPMDLERVTFGFTDVDDFTWDQEDFDLTGSSLSLSTKRGLQFAHYYGVGTVNFYWKLRLRTGVEARIYIDGPMVLETDSSKELDFTLKFESEMDGNPSGNTVVMSSTNPKVQELIYSHQKPDSWQNIMGYIPIEIETSEIWKDLKDQKFTATIGVVVNTI